MLPSVMGEGQTVYLHVSNQNNGGGTRDAASHDSSFSTTRGERRALWCIVGTEEPGLQTRTPPPNWNGLLWGSSCSSKKPSRTRTESARTRTVTGEQNHELDQNLKHKHAAETNQTLNRTCWCSPSSVTSQRRWPVRSCCHLQAKDGTTSDSAAGPVLFEVRKFWSLLMDASRVQNPAGSFGPFPLNVFMLVWV